MRDLSYPQRGLAAVLLMLLAGLWASGAHAFCGFYAGKADASLFNRASQVVVVRDGTRTVISMLNDYQGPLNEFALVVPTPTVLQKGQVRVAEKAVFEHLDAYSAPRLAEYHDQKPCDFEFDWGRPQKMYSMAVPASASADLSERTRRNVARDAALGVKVEVQYTLDEYDIISLSATQSDGLETWLRENGYRLPDGASAALRPYINQGMKFFVAKVNLKEQARLGYATLRPLQFAFDSEKFMLPMRLGMLNAAPHEAQDLIVYLLTKNGRVESSNYRTAPLPANMNLPFFIKPRFTDFYKALFDREARRQDHRVVFTEYFWDMSWCDPCAADPLSPKELRQAGVFWIDPTLSASDVNTSGAPVLLTRLHLRYTPQSFPEDLMFVQTRDRNNWQSRYVIQTPFEGSVEACSAEAAALDCAATCHQRIDQGVELRKGSPASQLRDCVAACQDAKQRGIAQAKNYFERSLPQRLAKERHTLAQLTGWSEETISRLPGAQRFDLPPAIGGGAPAQRTWWQTLFGS